MPSTKALMDVHTFLWWNDDNTRLPLGVRQILQNPTNDIYFSAASAWEIVIKFQTGKLKIPQPPDLYIPSRLRANNFRLLPVTLEHVMQVHRLPMIHRDPFDRLLIAQSQMENLPILTTDDTIRQYAVTTLW